MPTVREGAAPLVRVAPAYKFFFLAALACAACSSAPPAREQARLEEQARARAMAEAAAQERVAREARQRAEADSQALEDLRWEQIRREMQADANAGAGAALPGEPAQRPAAELRAELRRLRARMPETSLEQTGRGWVLTLADKALFDAGSAVPKASARPALDDLASVVRRHADREVAIETFTDAGGPRDEGRRLSERRAEALRQALVSRGVDPARLEARGYGASFPVATNETPEGRRLNRRVEIVINPS